MNPFIHVRDTLAAREDKRLLHYMLYDPTSKCGCVMGSVIPEEVRESLKGINYVAETVDGTVPACATPAAGRWATSVGLDPYWVIFLQVLNDAQSEENPHQRYTRVLGVLNTLAEFDEDEVMGLKRHLGVLTPMIRSHVSRVTDWRKYANW